ncbi:excinuclease ABC subunit UvrA [Corynebacterium sp. H113]|uniref:excinuclease ABC subunit UvrA n=1 Tax=Corynebacterium sp. H113 TaxID=3133419 RepID=UPI0030B7115D
MHPADNHNTIRVRGARVNNLRNINVDIPKRRLTVVTGVSGSGKSSLVFGTIAAESQRMINETYSAFVQGFMPSQQRPDVDVLDGLTTAIVVDQERLGADPRSTVGTATDAGALLRILFSRLATPHIGGPKAYSFNVASASGVGSMKKADGTRERREFSVTGGMCVRCEGRGTVSDFDLTALYDESLSLSDGSIQVPGYSMDGWYGRIFAGSGFFDMDKPVGKFSQQELDDLLYREPTKIKADGINVTYEGLIPKIQKSMLTKDVEAMQPHVRRFVEKAVVFTPCPDCGGTRLNEGARTSRITGADGVPRSIADCNAMQLTDLAAWVHALRDESTASSVAPVLESLSEIMASFVTIGLGYLSLSRAVGTLSGGESQRVKMVRHLGSALTDVTYVFDEPSIGLHPHDIQQMNQLLLQLRDKGNTVLVVEHKPEMISIADHAIDIGPLAGTGGGEIMYEGDVAGLRKADTVTGRSFSEKVEIKSDFRSPTGKLELRGASANNLDNVDVDFPTGVLTVLTGVAGSGKSSLVGELVAKHPDMTYVDQTPIKGSRRSNPATYTGLLEPIRKAFAKANGVKPAMFSPNSAGACPTCKGAGVVYAELGFMSTIANTCDDCGGKRFLPEVLEYTFGGRTIADVLEMSVAQAREFFGGESEAGKDARIPAAHKILLRLDDVGLGYLTLGQQLPTLSGGERQRLKLASQMGAKDAKFFVLDEPTTGLHLSDVRKLLGLLDRLVDSGATVLVIEHHQAVMAHADWIIDMGPGAGHDGGRVVFEGTPAQLIAGSAGPGGGASPGGEAGLAAATDSLGIALPTTITGQYLREYVGG